MEKFYLIEANIERKKDAIDYIEEHIQYNSSMNGTAGLDNDYLNYEVWLEKLELLKNKETCLEGYCPGREYFLIRENDNKLVGMINLRWDLTDLMMKYGGHIGYGIRPTERRKGYNKINLYLCLLKAQRLKLKKVLLTANVDNIGSNKTIISLGGVLENTVNKNNELLNRYWIDVDESIKKYRKTYEKYIRKRE